MVDCLLVKITATLNKSTSFNDKKWSVYIEGSLSLMRGQLHRRLNCKSGRTVYSAGTRDLCATQVERLINI